MNPIWFRAISAGIVVAAISGAVAIGGGSPPDLTRMAARSSEAAANLEEANRNIARAVRDTRALASIVSSVGDQLDASRRLLETQLRIESTSRSSAERSVELTTSIRSVRDRLEEVRADLATLARLAGRAGTLTQSSADSAAPLQTSLRRLHKRFDELIEESRELNRKARGYEELRDGPG